jgi:chemotaxis protein methyltransferase CheR
MKDSTQAISLERRHELSAFIHERFGLFFPADRHQDLLRAVEHACDEAGFDDAETYVDWVLSGSHSDDALEALVTSLTIGETYFFRDPALFSALREVVLPQRFRHNHDRKRIRLWSAGCSTGEEPYSIAMLLDYYGLLKKDWHIEVVATDVNVKSLSRARKGIYSRWSFRGMDADLQRRYFTAVDDHHWQLNEAVRRRIQFSYLNLAAPPFRIGEDSAVGCDVILCRNVLMYFSRELREQILNELSRMLVDGGWLVVSPSEAGLVRVEGLRAVNIGGMVLHQKGHIPVASKPVAAPRQTPRSKPLTKKIPMPKKVPVKLVQGKTVAASSPEPPGQPRLETLAEQVEAGEYKVAMRDLQVLTSEGTLERCHRAQALLLTAKCHANIGDPEQALICLDEALRLDQMNPASHYLYGVVLMERQENDLARQRLEKALYLDENYVMAQLTLAMLLGQCGDTEQQNRALARTRILLGRLADDVLIPDSGGMTTAHLRAALKN